MKELELKSKYTFADTELGDYLRKLANALDGEGLPEFSDLQDNLSNYSKIDLKIRRKDESVVLKLKAKLQVPVTAETTSSDGDSPNKSKPKYKSLKKRLKSDFKALAERIVQKEFPDARVVQSFIADSELMITYPGHGDEHYEVFREALAQFAGAFEKRDMVLLDKKYQALKQLMIECHKLYK